MILLYCHKKARQNYEYFRTIQYFRDPFAMSMYAISIIPVIRQLMGLARQVWYAADAAAGGGLLHFGIGGLGCCCLAIILVIMLMPLRFDWLVVKQGYLA